MSRAPQLEVERLSVSYGGVHAVAAVSFSVPPGTVLGIMGPNGAGKTTLLDAIAGLVAPTAGRIRLAGRDITRMPAYKRARAGIAVASQRPRPFETVTVRDHVRLTHLHRARRDRVAPPIEEVLARCGLDTVADHLPAELSPSQQRRLELAKALGGGPSLVLLDEIGAGLARADLAQIVDAVSALAAEGRTVLVIDHVMELLLAVASRLIVLDLGEIIADGEPDQVLAQDRVAEAYLGMERSDAART